MPEEYVATYINCLNELIDHFCESESYSKGLDTEQLSRNDRTLYTIIERVYKRKYYFLVFQDGCKISEYKEASLLAYWILKLRPLWIDPKCEIIDQFEKYDVNEYFALFVLSSVLNTDVFSDDAIFKDKDYIEELLYSMRFRDLTKEAFMLLMDEYYYRVSKKP